MIATPRRCLPASLLLAACICCCLPAQAVAVAGNHYATVELDARSADWHTLRRNALLAGHFLPPYRPITYGEVARLLSGMNPRVGRIEAPGLSPGLWRLTSCSCADEPMYLRFGGRLTLHELGPGDLVEFEAGLPGRGLIAALEPDLVLARGPLWLAVTPRVSGPLSRHRHRLPDALTYRGWPPPTGRSVAGAMRVKGTGWGLSLPRAVFGARLGRWSLTAGRFPASVGPGLDGDGLTLTSQAESLPQIVLRRTEPLRWSGILRSLAPAHVLARAGYTSAQTVRYRTEWGRQERRTTPVFSQWLLTWNHTSWWRTTVTHAALAAAREGETLWGDLPQINFPLLGATWSEMDYGPLTDRLFSLNMEWRFRDAPWPLLPSAAGRLWWEYGGEDYLPHKTFSFLPVISAPASLAGLELVDPRWDLGVQFLETRHPSVLWYSNSDFPRGYTHHDILLGHPLGGAVEAWSALVRLRTGAARFSGRANAGGTHTGRVSDRGGEVELRARTACWQRGPGQPTTARRDELALGWRCLADGLTTWMVTVGWVREQTGAAHATWLTARLGRAL